MKVCGIIAEYNPLHRGHQYHIQEIKKRNAQYIIVAMSGSFVQRGEPAAYDKWTRARWALEAGADVVLELPALYCLQSAEGFAGGGVRILAAAGCTELSFGSERTSVERFQAAVDLLEEEQKNPTLQEAITKELKTGKSYPRARHDAFKSLNRVEDLLVLEAMEKPNFLLGVEYIRAIQKYSLQLTPLPIRRIGAEHDQSDFLYSEYASASAIRGALLHGNLPDALRRVPEFVSSDLISMQPASLHAMENILLYALRTQSLEQLERIFGAVEGLHHTLKSSGECTTLDEILDACKSKRYTLARIRRLLCCAMIGITKDQVAQANQQFPQYLRLLGFRKSAFALFRQMSQNGWPIVSKKSEFDKLPDYEKSIFNVDRRANDIQALAFQDNYRKKAMQDYTHPIVIL